MSLEWTPDYPREIAILKKEVDDLRTKYNLLLDLYTDTLVGQLFSDYRGFYEQNNLRQDIDKKLKEKVMLPPFAKSQES